jgi:hypothetical protein
VYIHMHPRLKAKRSIHHLHPAGTASAIYKWRRSHRCCAACLPVAAGHLHCTAHRCDARGDRPSYVRDGAVVSACLPWLGVGVGADDGRPSVVGFFGRRCCLRPVPGEVGGGQVVPAVRRVHLPVRAGRLRLPPQRPPRRRVPQVPVEPSQLPAAQVGHHKPR